MGLLSWIVLGLIAGFLAQFLVGGGFGLLGTLILGIIGAVVGGFIASALGFGTVDGIDLTSIVIATLGAILVIAIARAAGGGRRVAV
jgi:uncharacterized membrane protein YeaQ/YmgE (transglycosylase-associated protein family)